MDVLPLKIGRESIKVGNCQIKKMTKICEKWREKSIFALKCGKL